MPLIDLRKIPKEEARFASQFLQEKAGTRLTVKGSQVQVDGLSSKDLKTLLRKFLHSRGLNDYKVVVSSGNLELHPVTVTHWKKKPPHNSPSYPSFLPRSFTSPWVPASDMVEIPRYNKKTKKWR